MKIESSYMPLNFQSKTDAAINKAESQKDFARDLQQALNSKDDAKLYKECQKLEAVFLNKVLQSARAAIPRSDFINRGFATETFESMLYEEYANQISQTDSIGIADILFRQLSQK